MEIIKLLREHKATDLDEAAELLNKKRQLPKNHREININSIFQIGNLAEFASMVNPTIRHRYSYILLDTDNRDFTLSTENTFVWRVKHSDIIEPGTIYINGKLRDLIGMHVMPTHSKFTGTIGEPGKIVYSNLLNTNYNFTILIHEFQAQSFVGRDNRRFHFSLLPKIIIPMETDTFKYNFITPTDPTIELYTKSKLDGYFWFDKPMTEFSTISISLANPFYVIPTANIEKMLIPIELIFNEEVSELMNVPNISNLET